MYIAFYNFCRVQEAIGEPSAMRAGLTDHVWSIVQLLSAA